MNLSNIAILNIKCFDYHRIISGLSKNEAINLMQNADLTEKSGTLQNIQKIIFIYIKMRKKILTFGDIEIEKTKFYIYKIPFPLRDVDIEKLLVSNKISSGKKNFIRYLYNDDKVKPLHIMLHRTSTYVKIYDGQT